MGTFDAGFRGLGFAGAGVKPKFWSLERERQRESERCICVYIVYTYAHVSTRIYRNVGFTV